MMRRKETPAIVYIMGYGYSGSTLLDTLVGNAGDFVSVGELSNLYRYAWRYRKRCACGARSHRCEFWSRVDRQWQFLTGMTDGNRLTRLQQQYEYYLNPLAWMRLFWILFRRTRPSFPEYAELNARLYDAIHDNSGRAAVVDSSKSPTRAAALILAGAHVHVIHLVRDSRGVVYSKWKRARQARANTVYTILATVRTAIGWTVTNLQCQLVARLFPAITRSFVKYEDVVREPVGALSFLNIPQVEADRIARLIESGQPLRIEHLISGNKMRKQASITIRPDFEWQSKLPLIHKVVVTFFTFPFLLMYGYPIRSRHHGRS